MKVFGIFALALTANAFASEYFVTTIDWKARYLEETTVLVCDDTSLAGVEIEIPGSMKYPEGTINFKDCGADWKMVQKKLIKKNGKEYSSVRFEGGSACTMEVKNIKTKQIFVLDIGDAC